jgi:hypothetical protein
MKAITITLGLLFCFNYVQAEKLIIVTKIGSEDGLHYDRIYEYSSDRLYMLKCMNPGMAYCPPIGIISVGMVVNFVEDELNSGNSSGVAKVGDYWVKWISTTMSESIGYQMIAGKNKEEVLNEGFTI